MSSKLSAKFDVREDENDDDEYEQIIDPVVQENFGAKKNDPFSKAMKQVKKEMSKAWKKAMKELKKAWDRFLDLLWKKFLYSIKNYSLYIVAAYFMYIIVFTVIPDATRNLVYSIFGSVIKMKEASAKR